MLPVKKIFPVVIFLILLFSIIALKKSFEVEEVTPYLFVEAFLIEMFILTILAVTQFIFFVTIWTYNKIALDENSEGFRWYKYEWKKILTEIGIGGKFESPEYDKIMEIKELSKKGELEKAEGRARIMKARNPSNDLVKNIYAEVKDLKEIKEKEGRKEKEVARDIQFDIEIINKPKRRFLYVENNDDNPQITLSIDVVMDIVESHNKSVRLNKIIKLAMREVERLENDEKYIEAIALCHKALDCHDKIQYGRASLAKNGVIDLRLSELYEKIGEINESRKYKDSYLRNSKEMYDYTG